MPFKKLGLSEPTILQGVRATGYTDPTPIQLKVIPAVLQGGDIIGCAQTGTGKTAAFALPILQRLATHPRSFEFKSSTLTRAPSRRRQRAGLSRSAPPPQALEPFRGTRALVLTPTRELCAQVETHFRDLGRFTDARTLAIYGGVGFQAQQTALATGVDIIVATPGRLLDLMGRRWVEFPHLEVLVLDEADRMLDMGFMPDVRRIVRTLPAKRQTMLFSATIPPEIEQLAREVLRSPQTIEVGRRAAPASGVSHSLYLVSQQQKTDLLLWLLRHDETLESTLIFTRTRRGADKLASAIAREGYITGRLHSDRTQSQREAALAAFRAGRLQIIVATDIAARGLDIEGVSHVINYDVPHQPEDYVHRIGRTARASALGNAITLVSREEERLVRSIEHFIGRRIPRVEAKEFSPPPVSQRPPAPARPRGTGGGLRGRRSSRR